MTLFSIHRDSNHPYPPRVTEFTRPFWDALKGDRFLTTRCKACAAQTFPPKVICPHCWSTDLDWVEPGIVGTLYSWTRVHAAPAVFVDLAPYALGIVDLACGIRLACPIVADQDLRCDMPIELMSIKYKDGCQIAARPVSS
jgi:uncharacterized OB-fold protein